MVTTTTRRLQPHDRHGVVVTTPSLVLTVAPAWRAPRPHPALCYRPTLIFPDFSLFFLIF
jgi:hypothetical protein